MQSETVLLKIVSAAEWRAVAVAGGQPSARWWRSQDGTTCRGYADGALAPDSSWVRLARLSAREGASHHLEAHWHYVVETDVAQDFEAEFNAWYDTEHLPGLARVPGTVRASRFLREGAGPRYLACYDLVSPETMQSEQWLAVRHTPWSARVRPMFANTTRTLYLPHYGERP